MKEVYIELTAFITGALVMILEILGFRMFAPFFGYSVYVSGMLIGIILVALALGAYIGGILSDRRPDVHLLFNILLIADAYLFLMAFFYGDVLRILSHTSILTGTLLASLILFAPPMALLGIVSPFLVKLATSVHNVGFTVGKVTAIGTVGSIAGTFLATFYLIPFVGTHLTLYISSVLLLLLIVAALVSFRRHYAMFLLLLFLFNPKPVQSEGNIVHQEESAYNLIKVVDSGSQLYLKLNNQHWIQSAQSKDSLMTGYYYDYLNIAPMLTKGKDILILGMAAGTSALQFYDLFDAYIDGVEIDPKVVDIAHRYFNLPKDNEHFHTYVDDARPFLLKSSKQYDVIEVDMYQGGVYVPFYVVTKEFFQLVFDHLKDGGVMIMNVYDPTVQQGDSIILNPIGATVRTVFPSLFTMPVESNIVLLAMKQSTTKEQVNAVLESNTDAALASLAAYGKENLRPFSPHAPVLTDNQAPIEFLTYKAVNR